MLIIHCFSYLLTFSCCGVKPKLADPYNGFKYLKISCSYFYGGITLITLYFLTPETMVMCSLRDISIVYMGKMVRGGRGHSAL